jgi:hypothetical protein
VICSAGGGLYAFSGNGDAFPGLWPFSAGLGGTFTSPAVGDVDGNGSLEIAVIAYGYSKPVSSKVFLLEADASLYSGSWPVTVDTGIVAPPVLGHIAGLAGDLEIVSGGTNGVVYVWNKSGVAWPSPPRVSGKIETSPALVNIDKDEFLEIVVSHRLWTYSGLPPVWHFEGGVTVVDNTGGILAGWPRGMGAWPLGGDRVPSAIALGVSVGIMDGSPADKYYGWNATGLGVYGFPLSLGSHILGSAAAGDLDDDGWVELVVATSAGAVHCYELRMTNYPEGSLFWPMFRHDRARTGCYGFEVPTGVDTGGDLNPPATRITSIFPNPFNPMTRIEFAVSQKARVNLSIYDAAGRRVRVLVNEAMEAGDYETAWNGRSDTGRSVASGIYFCRLCVGTVVETKKMVLMR